MRLVIESADQTKIGLAPGEYDLDDLGAVKAANVTGAQPGACRDIEIELRLHSGMKPEPGSIGEPHFKFGVSVEDVPQYKGQNVIIFGRPEAGTLQGQAFGYKATVDDNLLHGQSATVVEADVRAIVEPGVRAVADEIIAALVKRAVEQVVSPTRKVTATRSPRQQRQDSFFGLPNRDPHKVAKCDECGGSGVWKNPANGHESDCSKGCARP